MSLILSGTDGLSDVDGSAATPAIRGTDANTGIFFPAADTIAFSEGGVESMRLNSSGVLVTTNDASISGLTVGKGGGALTSNTVVGLNAQVATAGGGEVTAIGNNALTNNISTTSLTAVGSNALFSNTTGQVNVGVGKNTLYFNTTGSQNLAVGMQAAQSNTTGSNNSALGFQSLFSNTTASNNTAVGYQSIYTNTTGFQLTSVGAYALNKNTTGANNTAMGVNASVENTTGSNNTAIGHSALNFNTTASDNTAVGYQALYTNATGTAVTALGYKAGYASTGSVSVYVGYNCGVAATGSSNTFIGSGAGEGVTSGAKNTIVGRYNGNQGGLDIRTASNYIVLSDGDGNPRAYWNGSGTSTFTANVNGDTAMYMINNGNSSPFGLQMSFLSATPNNTSQFFFLGNDSTNNKVVLYSNGTVTNRTGTYNAFSDINLKQDIVDAGSQWDDIKAVRVRKFRLKDDVAANPEAKPMIGVIAQELEQTSAGLIDDCEDRDGTVTKAVKYSILYMKAIKALQEAMERIETLEAKVTALENK